MQYTLLDAWNTLQTINSNYFRGCHGSGLLLTFHYSPFYETKVTENDFNKFVSSVNRSLLPVGITFKMK